MTLKRNSADHDARAAATTTTIIVVIIIMDFPLTFFNNQKEKSFWSCPFAGFCRIRFREAPGQMLHRLNREDFLPVKSEVLRSSAIPVNELCLTSLLGALLPHEPRPFPPVFVLCMGMPAPRWSTVGYSSYRTHNSLSTSALSHPDPRILSLSLCNSIIKGPADLVSFLGDQFLCFILSQLSSAGQN